MPESSPGKVGGAGRRPSLLLPVSAYLNWRIRQFEDSGNLDRVAAIFGTCDDLEPSFGRAREVQLQHELASRAREHAVPVRIPQRNERALEDAVT
jgi:hypothetical protein